MRNTSPTNTLRAGQMAGIGCPAGMALLGSAGISVLPAQPPAQDTARPRAQTDTSPGLMAPKYSIPSLAGVEKKL